MSICLDLVRLETIKVFAPEELSNLATTMKTRSQRDGQPSDGSVEEEEELDSNVEVSNVQAGTASSVSGVTKNGLSECPICKKCFPQLISLINHVNFVHRLKKRFKCSICNLGFKHQCTLNVHFKKVHENFKPFKCDTCSKAFGENADLQRHINCVHLKLKTFQCKQCERRFDGKAYLYKHVKSMHEKEKKHECIVRKAICPICISQSSLQRCS